MCALHCFCIALCVCRTLAHHRDDVIITCKRILAGGLAGMLAKSVVAPVDRIKILFQVTAIPVTVNFVTVVSVTAR
jgi:Mitochondrial carrier protein